MEVLVTGPAGPAGRARGCGWILLWLLLAGVAVAQGGASRERQVQAVFLFHFAQFVEWPAPAFPTEESPVVIGVFGDDPFGPMLDEVVRDETVGGRPLVVRRFRQRAEIDGCHILFVGATESGGLEGLLAELKGRGILTVGDGENFARRGVMIRFVTERGRVRLRVNLEAAKAEGLTLSSKLLRAAEIVGTSGR